ncbi:hypothetical protein P4475_05855, partial [Halalkalibacterium halodurans]|uniref:hypothetical protein n=1 Tax=Halalkalibacterium halodurans TaxID=86665 RepID=UPI002E247142|nr:hypothetical protein [Halalkalibacterium halodurans]
LAFHAFVGNMNAILVEIMLSRFKNMIAPVDLHISLGVTLPFLSGSLPAHSFVQPNQRWRPVKAPLQGLCPNGEINQQASPCFAFQGSAHLDI